MGSCLNQETEPIWHRSAPGNGNWWGNVICTVTFERKPINLEFYHFSEWTNVNSKGKIMLSGAKVKTINTAENNEDTTNASNIKIGYILLSVNGKSALYRNYDDILKKLQLIEPPFSMDFTNNEGIQQIEEEEKAIKIKREKEEKEREIKKQKEWEISEKRGKHLRAFFEASKLDETIILNLDPAVNIELRRYPQVCLDLNNHIGFFGKGKARILSRILMLDGLRELGKDNAIYFIYVKLESVDGYTRDVNAGDVGFVEMSDVSRAMRQINTSDDKLWIRMSAEVEWERRLLLEDFVAKKCVAENDLVESLQ